MKKSVDVNDLLRQKEDFVAKNINLLQKED